MIVDGMIYRPQYGNYRMRRGISVLAIVLLIGLLFVAMRIIWGSGVSIKLDPEWVRGSIDPETGYAETIGNKMYSFLGFDKAYGMYTREKINIVSNNITISREIDSKYTYVILLYDEFDRLVEDGVVSPDNSGRFDTKDSELLGRFPTAVYLRVFAFHKDCIKDAESGFPIEEKFTYRDFSNCKKAITIEKDVIKLPNKNA